MKNKIFAIDFKRGKKKGPRIILYFEEQIPPLGYSPKELRRFLKEFAEENYHKC